MEKPRSQSDLERQLEFAENEIEFVNNIVKRITGKLRFDEIVQTIIDDAFAFMIVDRMAVSLINTETKRIDAMWVSGIPMETARKFGKGILGLDEKNDIAIMAMDQRKPLVCLDAQNDPRVTEMVAKFSNVKSFVVVPLLVQSNPIGFMAFENNDPARKITLEDIAKYQRFVDTLALFFHNARLYDELENWSHTLEQRVEEKVQELKDAHDVIWKINENLSAIVENDTSGIIATDITGKIVVFNIAASQIFRGGALDVSETHISSLFQREDYQLLFEELKKESAAENVSVIRNIGWEMIAVDGSLIPVNLSAMRLVSRDGLPFGFLFIIQDLREIRFLENQIFQGEKLKLLGEMTAGISHEINTPLGIIKGSLAALKSLGYESDERIKKHFSIIAQAVERGGNFVKELLNFSKPSPPKFSRLDVRELLNSGLEIIRPKYQEFSIKLSLEMEEELPPIYGDLQKLHQVLFNLMENAIDASGREGEILISAKKGNVGQKDLVTEDLDTRQQADPRQIESPGNPGSSALELQARERGGANAKQFYPFRQTNLELLHRLSSISKLGDELVVIQVRDTGYGISPEVLTRMFDPFFTTKRKVGTGLGLAIVNSIVQRHHGSINVISEIGRGTTFTLKLPIYTDIVQFERMI